MPWVTALILLLSVACSRSIPLGSECPDFEGPCPKIGDGTDADAEADDNDADIEANADAALDADLDTDGATAALDAGREDSSAGSSEGGAEADAGGAGDGSALQDAGDQDAQLGDGGGARFPGIRNPSFELPSNASAPVALDALGLQGLAWYGCRAGMNVVSEIRTASGAVVTPTEGDTFFADSLSADFTQSGVVQELEQPLKAGQQYALQIDVWAEKGNLKGDVGLQLGSGLLQLLGQPLSCILSSFTELDATGPIAPGGWQTKCLSFTPPRDATSITLLGYTTGPGNVLGLSGAQLFIDNLRPVAGCP